MICVPFCCELSDTSEVSSERSEENVCVGERRNMNRHLWIMLVYESIRQTRAGLTNWQQRMEWVWNSHRHKWGGSNNYHFRRISALWWHAQSVHPVRRPWHPGHLRCPSSWLSTAARRSPRLNSFSLATSRSIQSEKCKQLPMSMGSKWL